MRTFCLALLIFVSVLQGTSAQTPTEPIPKNPDPILDRYFSMYCGYTGSLGIGFVAEHTYDYQFRQRLATTEDAELKRLFVLIHLYGEVRREVSDFQKGVIMTGKTIYRKMTVEERKKAQARITELIRDLEHLDPGDPEGDIVGFRRRLNGEQKNGGKD